jgi:hypothetical protein
MSWNVGVVYAVVIFGGSLIAMYALRENLFASPTGPSKPEDRRGDGRHVS